MWLATAFAEFMARFNVLREPPLLGVLSQGFWAVAALAEAYALVAVLDRGRQAATEPRPAGRLRE